MNGGYGWVLDTMMNVHLNYPNYTWDELLYDIPTIRLFALATYAEYKNPVMMENGVYYLTSPMHIEAQANMDELLEMRKKYTLSKQ